MININLVILLIFIHCDQILLVLYHLHNYSLACLPTLALSWTTEEVHQ